MGTRETDHYSISPQHMKEKQWVRRIREEGDRDAFEKLFRTYYERLHGFAYSYIRQSEIAEDVVQTVFLRIWTKRECWNPPGYVKHYLFSAVKNEALNTLRHQRVVEDSHEKYCRESEIVLPQPDLNKDNETLALRKEIQKGIDNLPPRCRQIYILNRRNGLTYSEIADYLDLSINTVNTQMGRALKSLRDHLSDYLQLLLTAGITNFFL